MQGPHPSSSCTVHCLQVRHPRRVPRPHHHLPPVPPHLPPALHHQRRRHHHPPRLLPHPLMFRCPPLRLPHHRHLHPPHQSSRQNLQNPLPSMFKQSSNCWQQCFVAVNTISLQTCAKGQLLRSTQGEVPLTLDCSAHPEAQAYSQPCMPRMQQDTFQLETQLRLKSQVWVSSSLPSSPVLVK